VERESGSSPKTARRATGAGSALAEAHVVEERELDTWAERNHRLYQAWSLFQDIISSGDGFHALSDMRAKLEARIGAIRRGLPMPRDGAGRDSQKGDPASPRED
jgi:hypothetical protein